MDYIYSAKILKDQNKQESGVTTIDDYDYGFLLFARAFPLSFARTFSSSSDETSDSDPSLASGSPPPETDVVA